MIGGIYLKCGDFVVPRLCGQQLKDPAQLDAWLRDGSADHVRSLCRWAEPPIRNTPSENPSGVTQEYGAE